MSSTEQILDQIDDALDDWAVGPDAMRCNAPLEAQRRRGWYWAETPSPRLRHAIVVVRVDVEPFLEALHRAVDEVLTDLLARLRPRTGPGPLPIDGHAYHRRTRNRRRRR